MSTQQRLAIGPANYAEQAEAWCRGVRETLGIEAWSFTRGPVRRNEFTFEATKRIPAPLYYLPLAHKARMKRFFKHTTHVAIDGFQPFFAWYQRGDAVADALWLKGQGKQTALIAHGTDVRDPIAHLNRHEHSMFSTGDDAWRAKLTDYSRTNRDAAEASGLPLFVSTPDLLDDLPGATWLPICAPMARWRCDSPVLVDDVPTVLHMPSRRNPPIKGTQFVAPACEELAAEGRIRYVSPESVPHAEMVGLVKSADIVIDQLLAASYGVAAIEAMGAGRLVVGNVGVTRERIPADVPIVDANPHEIKQVLLDVLDNREHYRERAEQGRDFVNRWHDGAESAARLKNFLARG